LGVKARGEERNLPECVTDSTARQKGEKFWEPINLRKGNANKGAWQRRPIPRVHAN